MNKKFLPLKLFLLCCLIILSSTINDGVFANDKQKKKKSNQWALSLSVKPYYDSNILKYSEKYIDRFKNGEDPGRFHISSIDDFTIGYSAGLTFIDEFFGKMKTIIGTGYNSDAYSINSIKTWATFNIFFRQQIFSSTTAQFSYSYIPKFYVRHFRDDDWVKYYGYTPETFRPYIFSKDDFSFWLQQILPWKTTRARIYFAYDRYYLDESNTEYDSNDYMFGLRIYQSLFKNLDVNFGYFYTTSDAKGYDEPNETKENSDDSDASNYEHSYFVGFDYLLPQVFSCKNDVSIDFQYLRAFYTTENYLESDPLHAGRYDYNYRIYFNYNIELLENFSATAFYNWFGRESSTSAEVNREYVSNEKDYTQYRLGISFNYIIKF